MLVVALVCAAVAVVLLVVVVVLRRRNQDLADLLGRTEAERDQARVEASAATDQAVAARTERDEALDRVQRARRDAAEVANRLRDETAARTLAEEAVAAGVTERRALQAELDARSEELEAAAGALAMSGGEGSGVAEVLWALALDRVERTWRMSIALHPEETSPLTDGDDQLRAAVDILLEAAREEAGADIEVVWSGEGTAVPKVRAVQVLALLESVIGALAKDGTGSALSVKVAQGQVEIEVATADGAPRAVPVEVPGEVVRGPGRYVVAG